MAELQELQAALVNADAAGDIEAATKLAGAIKAMRTQPPEEEGILSGVISQVTGADRATQETEALPDWATMPEMNTLSMASFKSALGTMATNPKETAQIIQANFPNVQVRPDEKGNLIMRSSIDEQEYAIKPGFQVSDIPRAAGVMAAFTPAGRAATLARAGAAAAGTQAAIEATQAVTGGEIDPEEIVLAAGFGAGGKALEKGVTAIKGLVSKAVTPEIAAVKAAEEIGISPLTTDIIPPTTFTGKVGQAVTERIPITGTGSLRATQQAQRAESVRNLLREFGATETAQATDDVMVDLIKTRGKAVTKYSNLKNDVIDKLSGMGDVDVTRTITAIDDEISKLTSLRTEGVRPVIGMLNDYKTAFQGQNLKNVELIRKQLGEQLKSPDMASVRSSAEKAVSNIYKSLKKDMGGFIKETGERRDLTKWNVGNAKLAKMMGDLNVSTLKSTLAKGEATPELVRRMIFSQKPSDMKLLYRNLSPKGRARARVAILQEAAEKSGGIELLSADVFKNQLNRLSKSTGVFFTGKDREAVDGLLKALKLTKQAGTAVAKPATGAELTTFAAPSAITWILGGSPVAGLAATAAIGGMARVYESASVRNLLLKIARAKPGQTEALINQLTKAVQSSQIMKEQE